MHALDFLVPSALVDPALASELLRGQALPGLRRLVAHGHDPEPFELSPHAALTGWQAWVYGGPDGSAAERVNLGELWAMACGIRPAPNGGRFVAEPAHFKVANDHLRLDDPQGLAITLPEARALIATIEPVLIEAGWRLEPVEPATLTHWLLTRDDGAALSGAAIEKAIGDNVAAWQPRSAGGSPRAEATGRDDDVALAWRRCVNEIQMLWFGHPVNEARESNGYPAINTLWLSGNGAPATAMPPLRPYAQVDSSLPLLAALAIEPQAVHRLESFDGLIEPMRREDWSGWREQLGMLDARLQALLDQQAARSIGSLTVVFCGRDRARTVTVAPGDRGKFWRRWFHKPPALDLLFADTASSQATS